MPFSQEVRFYQRRIEASPSQTARPDVENTIAAMRAILA